MRRARLEGQPIAPTLEGGPVRNREGRGASPAKSAGGGECARHRCKSGRCAALAVCAVGLLALSACAPRLSRLREVAAFNAAGPVAPHYRLGEVLGAEADIRGPYRVTAGDVLEIRLQPTEQAAKPAPTLEAAAPATGAGNAGQPLAANNNHNQGPYRVVSGDVLELQMAGVLRVLGEDTAQQRPEPYLCRVGATGAVVLPAAGEVAVAGKTLAEVEETVVAAYFPKYVKVRPSVLARVAERRTYAVSVLGAVSQPGRYALPGDELSLVPLLARAGGLAAGGGSSIQIRNGNGKKPLSVPLKDGRTPTLDAPLEEGDVVEVEPGPLGSKDAALVCRVSDAGSVGLPQMGEVVVGGKTLAEVEEAIARAYSAAHKVGLPAVMARVTEYQKASVSAVGGVKTPGKYQLRSDELSLVNLLQAASGIAGDGAKSIRIHRRSEDGSRGEPMVVPVRDQTVPVVDVALKDGDTVEVERLDPRSVTVVGLVARPGVYPYPPNVTYTLQQVIAIAGGIDILASPNRATVLRQDRDGEIVKAHFKLGGRTLSDAAGVVIKPGDVVSVPHTTWTSIRSSFFSIFHAGVYATVPLNSTNSN